MALALSHQYLPTAAEVAAPAPWRMVNGYSEIAAILDANGRTVTLARRAVAARIVAAVNGAEGVAS